jgi:hypothetical protein
MSKILVDRDELEQIRSLLREPMMNVSWARADDKLDTLLAQPDVAHLTVGLTGPDAPDPDSITVKRSAAVTVLGFARQHRWDLVENNLCYWLYSDAPEREPAPTPYVPDYVTREELEEKIWDELTRMAICRHEQAEAGDGP